MEKTLARKNRYQLIIPYKRELQLSVQKVSFGDITLSNTRHETGRGPVNYGDNKIEFGPTTFNYLISNEFNEWIEIYNWMIGYTKNATFDLDEYAELTYFDTNNSPLVRFIFRDLKPESFTIPDFENENSSTMTETLTVEYEGLKIIDARTNEVLASHGFND